MASINEYSERHTIASGATETILVCCVGDISSFMFRSESSDFELMPNGCSSGVSLGEGEPFSRSRDDYKGIDANTVLEYRAKNTGSSSGVVSVWFTGVRS